MNKEMLKILDDLSKKPTTELALQIMELSSENLILKQQVKKQKEVINKAIEYIEKEYYSKNTFDIDNIGMTTNKLLQVRNILKEVSE